MQLLVGFLVHCDIELKFGKRTHKKHQHSNKKEQLLCQNY